MTLRHYDGVKAQHGTNPRYKREARHRQARAARAERIIDRRERRHRMDPIIEVIVVKLTVRSGSEDLRPGPLEVAGQALADELKALYAETGAAVEVNVTSIERVDD